MLPDLFSIGLFTIHTYGLFVAVGFIVALLVTVRLGRDQGFGNQQVMDMGFVIIVSALIGSRITFVLINLPHYLRRPLDIFKIWEGGLVFSGGLVTVIIVMIWYIRRHRLSYWKTGDLWAPAVSIGQGFGRIGCFMAGCCYGKPADLSWGVIFTNPDSLAPLNVSLHPTQIYSSLGGFAIFIALLAIHARKKYEGQVFLWFLILHSTARLAVERFRGDDRGLIFGTDMSATQLIALIVLFGAVTTLYIVKSRQENPTEDR